MRKFLALLLLSGLIYLLIPAFIKELPNLHRWVYALNIALLLQLVYFIGKEIVFAEFLSFSAVTLWLSIPLLLWDTGGYKLLVPNLFGADVLAINKTTYYAWALPATLSMVLGLYLIHFKKISLKNQILNLNLFLGNLSSKVPLYLFCTGSVALVVGPYMPGSLGFLFFLFSQLVFISVLYCLFGNYTYSKWIYIGASLISLVGVASSGMFGELVWWGLIIVIYALLKYDWSFIKKFILISIGIFTISILQSVKNEYRRLTWSKHSTGEAGISLLGKTAWKALFKTGTSNAKGSSRLVLYRMNHAYTVSLVMKNVPKKEPYARGETIFLSMAASFVPRFLWPDKPKSGGHENMMRFARFDPYGGASYDIGQIGDAWANFGFYGGILFLFIYGLANSWILKTLLTFSATKSPTLILWSPIIFLQLLKVEVSVLTNLNAAIKGAIFIYIIFKLFKFFGVKL